MIKRGETHYNAFDTPRHPAIFGGMAGCPGMGMESQIDYRYHRVLRQLRGISFETLQELVSQSILRVGCHGSEKG